jgi:hypothetical protein
LIFPEIRITIISLSKEDIMKTRIFIAGILISLLPACAFTPDYRVDIDSINMPGAETKTGYLLLPGEKGVSSENLQFKEYASYVERALSSRGFRKAVDSNDADIAIYLSYGIGEPQEHQYMYSIPEWGQTGFITSYRHVVVDDDGNYHPIVTYEPVYGVVDSYVHTETVTTYKRFLILDALDLAASRADPDKAVQLWQTTVTSIGSNGDLRIVFPILIGAAKEYIGSNTGKKVTVTLYENDRRVLDVKGLETAKQHSSEK